MGENMQNHEYEEMLILKAKSLKHHEKTYKFLECLEKLLKMNPYNEKALAEIAIYLKEKRYV